MARRAALKQVYSSEEALDFSKPTNRLRLRLDDMKTFQPLTDNQNKFFHLFHFAEIWIQRIDYLLVMGQNFWI